jgi:hypothetical protein
VSDIRLRPDTLVHGLVRGLAVGALGGCVVMFVLGVAAVVQTGHPAVIFVVVLGILPAAAIGCIAGAVLGVAAILAAGLASAVATPLGMSPSSARMLRASAAALGAATAALLLVEIYGRDLPVASRSIVIVPGAIAAAWVWRGRAPAAADRSGREAWVWRLLLAGLLLAVAAVLGALEGWRAEWGLRGVSAGDPPSGNTVLVATLVLALLGFCCLVGAFAVGEWPSQLRALETRPLTAVVVFVATAGLAVLALATIAVLVTAGATAASP